MTTFFNFDDSPTLGEFRGCYIRLNFLLCLLMGWTWLAGVLFCFFQVRVSLSGVLFYNHRYWPMCEKYA